MGYSKTERLEIGRKLYEGEITKQEAMVNYGLTKDTARNYMRYYRDANDLPPRDYMQGVLMAERPTATKSKRQYGLEDYEKMTRGELINELIEARINEARLKKGYIVKGDGPEKEFIRVDSKNTK